MNTAEVRLKFNLDREQDKLIYEGLQNLPKHFGKDDLSEAFMIFIDSMIHSLTECDKRNQRCQKLLLQIVESVGTQRHGNV
jgi:hypothetical protein